MYDEPLKDENILEKVEKAGFSYDANQEIFYSVMNPWQRDYGYCQLYDEACPPLGLIIDCEPIRFGYGGKRWLIEFWKGQYGMTAGGEIGVYNTDGPDINIPGVFDGTLYHSASDEDYLPMFYALRKGKQILFTREGRHWWLTGFELGEYTNSAELTMEARVTLKDREMRTAFANELMRMGYKDDEFSVRNNTVWVTYARPYSEQPKTRTKLTEAISQSRNRFFCEKFNDLTKNVEDMSEKLNIIRQESPGMFEMIVNMGRPKNSFKEYETIKRWIQAGVG